MMSKKVKTDEISLGLFNLFVLPVILFIIIALSVGVLQNCTGGF